MLHSPVHGQSLKNRSRVYTFSLLSSRSGFIRFTIVSHNHLNNGQKTLSDHNGRESQSLQHLNSRHMSHTGGILPTILEMSLYGLILHEDSQRRFFSAFPGFLHLMPYGQQTVRARPAYSIPSAAIVIVCLLFLCLGSEQIPLRQILPARPDYSIRFLSASSECSSELSARRMERMHLTSLNGSFT